MRGTARRNHARTPVGIYCPFMRMARTPSLAASCSLYHLPAHLSSVDHICSRTYILFPFRLTPPFSSSAQVLCRQERMSSTPFRKSRHSLEAFDKLFERAFAPRDTLDLTPLSLADDAKRPTVLGPLPPSPNRTQDRKSTRLNSSHSGESRMPSSA